MTVLVEEERTRGQVEAEYMGVTGLLGQGTLAERHRQSHRIPGWISPYFKQLDFGLFQN